MEAIVAAQQSYAEIVTRLNRASVSKHFDAYIDVPWDEPTAQLDVHDPRWELASDDPLGATSWYRSRRPEARARIGLGFIAYAMRRGMEFENVLSRGLLEFAMTRPRGSTDFRYAYHELIEEGQHSLMFQEFVNRAACDVPRMAPFQRFFARRVPGLARSFPELFFLYVLAGEMPIDQTQRTWLRRGEALHPLVRKIMQIHVSEEARHVCFAQKYLAAHVPKLSTARRLQLQWMAPFICAETAKLMLAPPHAFTRSLGIPRWVMADVYTSRCHESFMTAAVQPLYETLEKLQLVTPTTAPVWQLLGLGSRAIPMFGADHAAQAPRPRELQNTLTQGSQNARDCAR